MTSGTGCGHPNAAGLRPRAEMARDPLDAGAWRAGQPAARKPASNPAIEAFLLIRR